MSTNVKVHYQGFLEGHNGWVTSLQVGQTKEGKPLLISGSRDKSIIVWKLDLENPEEIKNEKGFSHGLKFVSWAGDGQCFIVKDADGTEYRIRVSKEME